MHGKPELAQFPENQSLQEAIATLQSVPKGVRLQERSYPFIYEADIEMAGLLREQYGLGKDDAFLAARYISRLDLGRFGLEELALRDVLDVGSGPDGGIVPVLDAIAPEEERGNHVALEKSFFDRSSVQADASRLPFRSESFDAILALASVPDLGADHGEYDRVLDSLDEMYRVLRSGGALRVYPLGHWDPNPSRDHAGQDSNERGRYTQEVILDHLVEMREKGEPMDIEVVGIGEGIGVPEARPAERRYSTALVVRRKSV